MNIHAPPPDNSPYPSKEEHRSQWRSLARAIAARAGHVTDEPDRIEPPERVGELVVLGSGIEAAGFTRADESIIDDADKVFYCVADPATRVWIGKLRPDAFDLYVLYDDAKPRYVTYMQMTEAMLHYVRQGQKVAAIFYGHPGIFVLSTHRAIKIARREGHRAQMRPAVSALDTLCADLGVDPSQPGMAMYEASDMLIRGRKPDTGLHLVLWQVGLIGQLGYRRQGYINANFGVLLDYLEELYGPDHEVVNYVGSRYPGLEPQIDRQTIASLRDPDAQCWVTGISTFYLPPKDAAPSDPAMLERLGLIRPGQKLRVPDSPLRVIDKYGARERKAFDDFASFDVPRSYQWQNESRVAGFILALREDGQLRELYRRDPAQALAAYPARFDPREQALLMRRDPGAMQIAAKELRSAPGKVNRRFFNFLLSRTAATRKLRRAIADNPSGRLGTLLKRARADGFELDWLDLDADWDLYLRHDLAAWSGFYLSRDPRRSLAIHARPGGNDSRIVLDGVPLKSPQFGMGTIAWSQDSGNPTNGRVQVDILPGGARRLVGLIWPAGGEPSEATRFAAGEVTLRPRPPLSGMAGSYGDDAFLPVFSPDGAGMRICKDGTALDDAPTLHGDRIAAGNAELKLADRAPDDLSHAHGVYRLRCVGAGVARVVPLQWSGEGVVLGEHELGGVSIRDGVLGWTSGPDRAASGQLSVLFDPITLSPMVYGTAQSADGGTMHLRGMRPPAQQEVHSLSAAPRLGLPDWAWSHLLAFQLDAATKGGLFLWHGWDRAGTNMRRISSILDLLREPEGS